MESPASILRRHGLTAKKSWGQCFLHDPSVIQRIVEATGLPPRSGAVAGAEAETEAGVVAEAEAGAVAEAEAGAVAEAEAGVVAKAEAEAGVVAKEEAEAEAVAEAEAGAVAGAETVAETDTDTEAGAEIVVEIGAGLGALTHALATRAARVICIERDRDMVKVLRQEFADTPQVEIREENALTFDFSQFDSPVPVVGNLPYNISSPLIFHLLDQRQHIRSATLMLQREVAMRIVADPGTKAYGVPSVLCQQAAEARLCFGVSSGCFTPRPRVESAVIQLRMRARPRVEAEEPLFTQVVKAAFQYRRKTLKRALGNVFPAAAIQQALAEANINGSRRGETLTIEEFGALTRVLTKIILAG